MWLVLNSTECAGGKIHLEGGFSGPLWLVELCMSGIFHPQMLVDNSTFTCEWRTPPSLESGKCHLHFPSGELHPFLRVENSTCIRWWRTPPNLVSGETHLHY